MSGDGAAIDLVLRRVRLRARCRAAWLRRLWVAEQRSPGGVLAIADQEADTLMEDRDAPAREARWIASADELAPLRRELEQVERELSGDRDSRLARVRLLLGLEEDEVDLLHGCVAQGVDPALGRVYGYLQDHAGRPYLTAELAARLFGRGRLLLPPPGSALWRWGLVVRESPGAGEQDALLCDPGLLAWLGGRGGLAALAGSGERLVVRDPLEGWPVDETAAAARRIARGRSASPVRVRVLGAPGSGRRSFAAAVSRRLDLAALAVDADAAVLEGSPVALMRVRRAALLGDCAIVWYGDTVGEPRGPAASGGVPVEFLVGEQPPSERADDGAAELTVRLPPLSDAERRDLWRDLVPGSRRWAKGPFEDLVRGHRVTVGDIAAAARRAPRSPAQAAEAVRESRRGRLGTLAQLLDCPFGWDDLVVSPELRDALEDLVFEARTRGEFWERGDARRMFPQGRGLLALFSGPPGTGKTMAAQVVAAALGQDLLRVDLSAVVSKWVGDTAKHLQKVLSRSEGLDVVLFFDECDALFARRTKVEDAQARFANTDTSYLLQAIESYEGVCILASNRRADVDPAFIRRLRYGLEFPRPDSAYRLEIWQRVLAQLVEEAERAEIEPALPGLAEAIDATGAQIKAAVLTGLFRAQREEETLGAGHLMRGVQRELQKEGRGLSPRDRERLATRAA